MFRLPMMCAKLKARKQIVVEIDSPKKARHLLRKGRIRENGYWRRMYNERTEDRSCLTMGWSAYN